MEFLVNSFKSFLDMHKVFYMHEIPIDGKSFIDMVIDDNDLKNDLLSLTYTLDTDESIGECAKHNLTTSERLVPCVTRPEGRSENTVRIILDEYYATKINKIAHAIMSHPVFKY